MEDIQRSLVAEQRCIQLIAEFLLYNDFKSTLPIFMKEVIRLDYQQPKENVTMADHIKRRDFITLISVFESSDHNTFFKAWSELVPSSIKEVLEYKHLTIYMHVYFAILPFRNIGLIAKENDKLENNTFIQVERNGDSISKKNKYESVTRQVNRLDVIEESNAVVREYDTDSLDQSQVVIDNSADDDQSATTMIIGQESGGGQPRITKPSSLRSAMDALKRFLATEGETYSSQQEFLQLFALPYVTNPHEHPSFTSLFQEHWLHSIQDKYYRFIHRFSFGKEIAPQIIIICEEPTPTYIKPDCEQNPVIAYTDSSEIMKRYNHVKRKFTKLQKNHQSLIGVAAELTSALENSARGQAVDLAVTLRHCALIYPELFAGSHIGIVPPQLQVSALEPLVTLEISCSELDVHRIKNGLMTADLKSKLLLMQALRWLITKSNSEDREQVVTWLSRNDLLEVRREDGEGLVKRILRPTDVATPHPLQQGLARLLNAVVSIRVGRDYLAHSHPLLNQLIICVKQDNSKLDTTTADMILATLQKLSLRRAARLVMIEGGLMLWVIGRLQEEASRVYSLEYSTALLLNLCLHHEARQRCPDSIVKTLTDLLDTEHNQILPLVTASLYCLLSVDRLHCAARRLGLERLLVGQIDRRAAEPDTVCQLRTLLRMLRSEMSADTVKTMSDEPDEDDLDDPEILEAELDADDPVKPHGDDQCGEALLRSQYRRIFPAKGIVSPNRPLVILPSTPRSRPPTRGE